MYDFVQKLLDGLSFDQMEYRTYGRAGFGIEMAPVVDRIANPRLELARDWRVARETAPPRVEVKITGIGPHMLAKFSNNKCPDFTRQTVTRLLRMPTSSIRNFEKL